MQGTRAGFARRSACARIRVAASAIVFLLYAAAFAFSGSEAAALAGILPKLQFFPALLRALSATAAGALGGAIAIASAVLLLTAMFGRVYCACLCPLGALQDGLIRAGRAARTLMGRRSGSRRAHHGAYRRGRAAFHAGAFVLAAGAAIAGSTILLGLLEPFSAFGKIGAGLVRPLADLANNGLAALSGAAGSFAVATVTVSWAWARALVGTAALFIVGSMSLSSGRLYCNSLCPAGAVLRAASFRPWFGLGIDSSKCNRCGACERVCRASCARPAGAGIDENRCVRCFDCVSACPSGAIRFGRARPAFDEAGAAHDSSRRRFLSFGTAAAVGVAGAVLLGGSGRYLKPAVFMNGQERPPAAPPGAGSVDRFLGSCTACGSCVAVCPSGVIRPAEFQWGILDPAKPYLAYDRAYCQFECDRCLRSCPTGALRQLSLEEKKLTRLGQSSLALERCIVVTNKTRCGSCAEHCPTGAVSMSVPKGGGLPLPATDTTLCIGCGACETACPVQGRKAIHVEGLKVQDRARFLLIRPGDRGSARNTQDGEGGGTQVHGTIHPSEGKDGFPF
jgi:ferredoxin